MIEIKANPGKHGGVDQRDLTSAALNVQRAFLCSPANPDPAYSWQGTLRSRAKADVQTVLSGFSLYKWFVPYPARLVRCKGLQRHYFPKGHFPVKQLHFSNHSEGSQAVQPLHIFTTVVITPIGEMSGKTVRRVLCPGSKGQASFCSHPQPAAHCTGLQPPWWGPICPCTATPAGF